MSPQRFDKTGAQVGEQLPDLPVYDVEGKEHGLREVAGGNPALLLTSSLTCPKSRSTCPQAKEVAAALGSRVTALTFRLWTCTVGRRCIKRPPRVRSKSPTC